MFSQLPKKGWTFCCSPWSMTLCATVEDIGLVHAEIWPRLTESQVSQIVGIIEKKIGFLHIGGWRSQMATWMDEY